MRACDSKEAKALMKEAATNGKTIDEVLSILTAEGYLDRNSKQLSYSSVRRLALKWGIRLKGMRQGKVPPAKSKAVDAPQGPGENIDPSEFITDLLTSKMKDTHVRLILKKLVGPSLQLQG